MHMLVLPACSRSSTPHNLFLQGILQSSTLALLTPLSVMSFKVRCLSNALMCLCLTEGPCCLFPLLALPVPVPSSVSAALPGSADCFVSTNAPYNMVIFIKYELACSSAHRMLATTGSKETVSFWPRPRRAD